MKHNYCATIGFFDGVHRGHQYLISQLARLAHATGREALVVTFDRHPRQVVHADYVPQLLTTTSTKVRLLAATAADRVEVLHFDEAMARLSARDFMREVLLERYGATLLLTGYDNRFGHNRAESFVDYVRYGKEMGMEVVGGEPVDIDGKRVSSSLIRRLLVEGNVVEANHCLGRPFAIEGNVVHGFQEGRRIGFPTANIVPTMADGLIPQSGVYAARASVEGGAWLPAMVNIGTNPTFARQKLTIEAHLIGFEGDIYNHPITVEFIERMRGERRFANADELKAQLLADQSEALRIIDIEKPILL